MAIDFPNAPTVGQVFTSGAQSWTWDGTKWVASGAYVGPPQYPSENRIINGDMRIDQRNARAMTAPAVPIVYVIDRWQFSTSQISHLSFQGVANGAPGVTLGVPYALAVTVATAYTLLVSDYFILAQPIEADMISDFAFGTPNAQPVTLSFWVSSTVPGTYSGSIVGAGATRSYPFTFPVVTGWTKVVVTIPGDTAGAWVLQGNGVGTNLRFDLGSGANLRGPAGAWAAGNIVGANGALNFVSNAANSGISFSNVKLEVGSVATPFNRPTLAKALADCQRYYQQVGYSVINGYSGFANGPLYQTFPLPVYLRAQPTFSIVGTPVYTNCSTLTGYSLGQPQVTLAITVASTSVLALATFGYALSAEL
jgi:hypothetical protein